MAEENNQNIPNIPNNQNNPNNSDVGPKNAQAIIIGTGESKEAIADPLTKREGIYNDLIDAYKTHYETKSKHNRGLKIAFFWIIMSLITILIIGLIILCVCVVFKWENSSQSIAIIITSVGTILSTIIALPTIICNYLFHKKEDKDLLDFIVELNKKDT
ncbi:MAG: hypothetical protein NC033_05675 [Clostridiales bacterium]|nr:hypothetical protein [Clostridiales bacterium]